MPLNSHVATVPFIAAHMRLSTSNTLIISYQMGDLDWEHHLELTLRTSGPSAGLVRLVNGRKLQYKVVGATLEEEDGFVILIRHTLYSLQE